MKKLTLFISLLFINCSLGQEIKIKRFSIATNVNYSFASGDNFLNKAYGDGVGVDIEGLFNIHKNFFIGIKFQENDIKLTSPEYIGNFYNPKISSYYVLIGYRNFVKSNKIYFEHKIGFGDKKVTNTSDISSYSIVGNSFEIGSRINFGLKYQINFYFGIDANFTKYDVKVVEKYKPFYNRSTQFLPVLGFKLQLGKAIKPLKVKLKE